MKAAQKASSNWETEREQLIAERDQLMQLLTETEEAAAIALERQIATAVDRVRNELIGESDKLRFQLQEATKASKEWAAERARLVAESERTAQMLSGSDEAAAIALERQVSTAAERTRSEMNAKLAAQKEEHQRALAEIENNRSGKFHKEMTAVVASVRGELEAEADKLRKEIERLKGEKDQAQMQLADVQNEHAHCKSASEHAAANAKLESEMNRLREELSAASQLLTEIEQLAKEREETNKLLSDALDKQRGAVVEGEKAAAQKVRAELDAELKKVSEERAKAQAEQNRLQQELQRVSAAAAEADRERKKLANELEKAKQAPVPQQPETSGAMVDLDALREETARVEASLQEIIKAVEDPSAELSFVVRKNVERAQLDSYLQGLRFGRRD
jgi:hypothetical protein